MLSAKAPEERNQAEAAQEMGHPPDYLHFLETVDTEALGPLLG
jgi:hypothetical protein